MKRLGAIGVALGSALAGAALVFLLAGTLSTPRASAGGASISAGTGSAAVGSNASTALNANNVGSPGLGAWSIDVQYDPSIVSIISCSPGTGSVCNPAFSANMVRVAGASASGILGTTTLATLTFHCLVVGTSNLAVNIDTLADATPGGPVNIPASATNGGVTCQTAATPTRTPLPGTATPRPPTPTSTPILSPVINPPLTFHGFPIPGGTYVGDVRGTGTITVVVTPDGQGISEVRIADLVTPCGAFTHDLILDPALNIQEPGFSLNLGKVSEGSIGFSMTGLFAEDGTIPVDMQIHVLDPSCGEGSTLHVVLRRVGEAPAPRPQAPAPSTLHAPNAGFGPGPLGADTAVWLVAGLIGAGIAWLCAGLGGAGLATASRTPRAPTVKRAPIEPFAPHMRPVDQSNEEGVEK